MQKRPAVIRGRGIVTALGTGVSTHVAALRGSPPSPQTLELPVLDTSSRILYRRTNLDETEDKVYRLIEIAVDAALTDASLDQAQRRRCALLVGSSSLEISQHEQELISGRAAGWKTPAMMQPEYGRIAARVADTFGIHGPQYTFNTACSASGNALLYAGRIVDADLAEYALVIGSECYNRLSVYGFNALMLTSLTGMRPFDTDRDGLVLGEGAAAVLLGSGGDPAGWQLRGGASRCDTSSPTNSEPGRIAAVIHSAVSKAGYKPEEITAIKAHGTATPSNDLSEGLGMQQVFADSLPPFTSIKPFTGHTLGACGAIETISYLACLDAGFLPPTPGFESPDPDLGISPIAAVAAAPSGPQLLNFFGFGGNNCSLVFARQGEPG